MATSEPTTVETTARPADVEPPGSREPYRWRWVVLAVILVAEVMDLLDSTVVNIAAPTIRAHLGGAYSTIQWVAAGYTLAFAVMLITGGRLGDIFGRRRLFIIGALGFTVASAACAVALSPGALITSRVIQGAFGAVLIPQGLGMIRANFPPKEMTAAFGLFGPVIGLSAVGGPIMAGALIDADLWGTGWRMIFLINVPLGLLAVAGAVRFMPESRSPQRTRLDVPGMLMVTAAAVMLIYPLVQGRDLGWPLWTYGLMAGSVPLLAVFVWYERRRGDSPLIEPALFGRRPFTAGLAVLTGFFCAVAGLMLAFGVFTQTGLGFSPLKAGLAMVPWALGTAVGAAFSGGLLGPRMGRHIIHIGLIVLTVGLFGVILTLRHSGLATTAWDFVPAMGTCGIGMGLAIAPLFNVILAGVDDREVGAASGVLNAMQQLGSAVGVAVVGTVFFDAVGRGTAFPSAMTDASWTAFAIAAVTVVLVFWLPRNSRPETE
jgi:EmrB/QacA subfamily drug resistance transporter